MTSRRLPSGRRIPLWATVTGHVVGGLGTVSAGALMLVHQLATEHATGWLWAAFGSTCLAGVVELVSAVVTAQSEISVERPDDIEAALTVAHSMLAKQDEWSSDQIRLTLHVRTKRGTYCQVTPYIGEPQREACKIRREYQIGAGIVGLCFRTGKIQVACRQGENGDDYRRELVSKWGFTPEEASKRKHDTASWLAWPLSDKGKVDAVVYADATHGDFFDDNRLRVIGFTVIAIARHLGRSPESVHRQLSERLSSTDEETDNGQ